MKQPNFGNDLKIIVIGNPSTGKTSLVNKWITGHFTTDYKATIAAQFKFKVIKKNDTYYRIQIWDLAGQDRDGTITKVFCKDTQGVFILCTVKNEESLQDTIKWKKIIDEELKGLQLNTVPVMLLQNKVDLLEDANEDYDRLKEFARRNEFCGTYRTSAKTGENINEAMDFLLTEIIKDTKDKGEPYIEQVKVKRASFKIVKKPEEEKKGCCS